MHLISLRLSILAHQAATSFPPGDSSVGSIPCAPACRGLDAMGVAKGDSEATGSALRIRADSPSRATIRNGVCLARAQTHTQGLYLQLQR